MENDNLRLIVFLMSEKAVFKTMKQIETLVWGADRRAGGETEARGSGTTCPINPLTLLLFFFRAHRTNIIQWLDSDEILKSRPPSVLSGLGVAEGSGPFHRGARPRMLRAALSRPRAR